jgi:hypothetical protein
MLNGRVYGGPKHKPPSGNPFANARDEDVEFVEWGYGGMGSVRGAKSAGVGTSREGTNWSRLQHNGRNVVAGSDRAQGNAEADDDDDDGSGIGWVKKRKAARERKEKEEKERAEAQAAAQNTLPPVLESEDNTSLAPTYTRHPSSSSVATAIPSSPVDESSEHVYTAVTVPAHLPRHPRRSQPRSTSIDTTMSMATVVPIPEEGPLSTESDSESESEDGVRQAEDEYGDDDDEDDDEDKNGRSKTALGAGVEKISRHNQSP